MPSPEAELVRSIFSDWERGVYSSVDWASPEIEFVIADGPDPGRWRGLAGMGHRWREFLSNWEDVRAVADEYLELGDGRVVVLFRQVGRGRTSGLEVAQAQARAVNLFEVHGGKVTRLVLYFEPERAFSELGVAREADGS